MTIMRLCLVYILVITAANIKQASFAEQEYDHEEEDGSDFSDIWAVQIAEGANPDEVAIANGFKNKGPISEKDRYFEFVPTSTRLKKRNGVIHESRIHRRLSKHPHIKWYKRQRYLNRVKREVRECSLNFNDPQAPYQWYICNNGQYNGGLKGMDLNIEPVWQKGYTGKGIKVSVLDDGLDHTHPDIKANYDPKASYDLNGEDNDPYPRDSDEYNAHGTKCSGEIAAVANNSICGVGVAYNVNIGAVRMLDGKATDSLEARALGFNNDYIDIYSCSWGPKDDGTTFGRPARLAKAAFVNGATHGRQGKGNIYVWATGNGGLVDDDCNCDGYTTSIYSLSIGSISDHGLSTYYDEKCSSTIAVVYTSDSHDMYQTQRRSNGNQDKLVTTGLHHTCETTFRGTSSAAPLAAGVIALLLEANPNLTWRDVQHIVINTAKKTSPLDEGWKTNSVGRWFNHKFGFGVMDALAMVNAGLQWENVAPQRICEIKGGSKDHEIPHRGTVHLGVTVTGCPDRDNDITQLEHVIVTVSLRHHRRGDLNITLVSPSGTTSNLLSPRRHDKSDKGLSDWGFMTVHLWGENPVGHWKLYVRDQGNADEKKGVDNEARYGKMLDERKANKRARDFIPRDYDMFHDEVHHGRYKEDYMRNEIPDEVKRDPWYFGETHRNDDLSSRKSTHVGVVQKWSITLHGTGQ